LLIDMRHAAVLAALLVPLSGCELGLLIAAVTDEPTPDYYDPEEFSYCNEFGTSFNTMSGPLPSAESRATVQTVGSPGVPPTAPLGRLAAGEQLDLFVIAPDLEAGPETTIALDGDLERLDESSGTCVPSSGAGAASFVSLATGEAGEGAIVVLEDGAEYDRFDFTVVAVEGISLSLDLGGLRATLFDRDGHEVFAHTGVEWQFVPSNPATVGPARGLTVPLFSDGIHDETRVTVFFQELEATTTVRFDSSTGTWVVAE
jgi:hypothetical protein